MFAIQFKKTDMFLTLNQNVGQVPVRTLSTKVIDLNGPEGNAFFLLGKVSEGASALGLSKFPIVQAMLTSGNYLTLVAHFELHLGKYYYLILPDSITPEMLTQEVNRIRKEAEDVQN